MYFSIGTLYPPPPPRIHAHQHPLMLVKPDPMCVAVCKLIPKHLYPLGFFNPKDQQQSRDHCAGPSPPWSGSAAASWLRVQGFSACYLLDWVWVVARL